MRVKMDAAVTMAKVAGNTRVDWALGHAAVNGRFGHKDLASILNAHPPTKTLRATESRSLSQGTSGWAQMSDSKINDRSNHGKISDTVNGDDDTRPVVNP